MSTAGPVGSMWEQGTILVFSSKGCTDNYSWNKELARQRGMHMGQEFRQKGVQILLGPVVGPIGRVATGGRNWEGFSSDPYHTGALGAETIIGTQSRGVSVSTKVRSITWLLKRKLTNLIDSIISGMNKNSTAILKLATKESISSQSHLISTMPQCTNFISGRSKTPFEPGVLR